jgi:hypothetical protein
MLLTFRIMYVSKFLLLSCVAVVTFSCSPSGDTRPEATPGRTDSTKVLAAIRTYLHDQLPGWDLPAPGAYSTLWWSFYDKTVTPYMATADLNDDGVADHGLIVTKGDSIGAVILTASGDTFRHWFSPFRTVLNRDQGIEYGVNVEPAGRIDIAQPRIESLVLTSNAVNLYNLEVRTAVFYNRSGSMSVFRTR